MSSLDIVVGRQPVFNAIGKVTGYELLLHDTGGTNESSAIPPPASGHHATSEANLLKDEGVLKLVDVGIDRLVGDRTVQLKAHRSLLLADSWRVFPSERTVLVVRSFDGEDPDVLNGCRKIAAEGYKIAVDDGVFVPGHEGLLEIANVVWIDVRDHERSKVEEAVKYCKATGKTTGVIDIDLKQELDECSTMGFDLFQGYLLSLPQIVVGRSIEGNKLSKLRLSAALLDSETDVKELESIVRLDPSMTRQILRLAGAGSAGRLRREVKTIRGALVLAGWRRLQSWVALLMLADEDGSTEEEIVTSLIRARACELLARSVAPGSADLAYAAGMLSSFDLLLKVDLETALASMPLDAELLAAVKTHEGEIGTIVEEVIAYQTGRLEAPDDPQDLLPSGASIADIQRAMAEALIWAVEATSAMVPDDSSG